MEESVSITHYPANWPVRFLCDCKKKGRPVVIRDGVARDISAGGMHILSDHHICSGKKVAVQLVVPPLHNGKEPTVVNLVGHSRMTVVHEGDFLTDIEFVRFEGEGLRVLQNHLRQRFDHHFFFTQLHRFA
jgi:hypothetical protein